MKFTTSLIRHAIVIAFVTGASGQLLAADSDKGKKENHSKQNAAHHTSGHRHFDNDHKTLVRNYFDAEKRDGRCPPGLAKKQNSCTPPGQVKHWQLGQHLPHDVKYSLLPADLTTLLGQPQPGYHYGMIDADILLLLDATEMVVDAIYDLGH